MKLTIHRTDNGATVTIHMASNGSGIRVFRAELEAKPEYQYAMVDGMLWTLLRSELEAFNLEGNDLAAHEVGNGLVHYMRKDEFYNGTQEDAQRITRTIATNVLKLAPLAEGRADLIAWHAHIVAVANLLKARMVNVGDTWHGIEAFTRNQVAA